MKALQVRQKPPKLATRSVEFRSVGNDNGDGRTLEGYGAVFNRATTIDSWYGSFEEEIAPGAFKRTLKAKKPVLQFDHGQDKRTGSIPIGAIDDIREDDHGLFVRARLFDNDLVEPIRQAIEAGAIDGMSFRFRIVREDWRDAQGKPVKEDDLVRLLWDAGDRGPIRRTIREVELFEVGPVVFPAYEQTSVGVRAMLADLDADERDRLLRDLLADGEPTQPATETTPEPAPKGTSGSTNRSADPAVGHSAPTKNTETRSKAMTQPMSVDERRERQEEIRTRLAEIDEEFADGELSDEARGEFDKLTEEFERHDRAVKDVEERRARLARLARNDAATERVGRESVAPNVIVRKSTNEIYDLGEIRRQARSLDDMVTLTRDNAMRAIERARFGLARGISREDAQTQAERLLDTVDDAQGTLARRVLATGSPVYERAFGKAAIARSTAVLTAEEQRAMSLGVDGAGGFAVPFQLDPTVILTSAGSVNPLRQVARVEQIVGKEWEGITSAGITVTRSPEAQEATDNSSTLVQPTVKPERVLGFVPFSYEIDQDWPRLRAEMTTLLADAKDQEEADSFVNGNGTAPNPAGIVATLPAGSVVAAAATGAFTSDDLYLVEEALGPRFRGRASWLANKAIYNKVRGFDTAGGADLWVRLPGGMPAELIGYPARELSTMDGVIEATGSGSNKILLFGDYRTGFLIVDRIGMSMELVPHLFGAANRYPTGQRGIVAVWRNSSKVIAPEAIRLLNVTSNV